MKRFITLITIMLVLVVSCQSGSATQPADPAAVMDAYTAAINAHDVEAALSYVADDAVYDRSVGAFNGKEEVRGFIQGIIDRNVHVELIGERTVDGERVTWQSRVMLDDPANPGGPQIEVRNNSESIVRDGKIVMHTARPAQ
jgi:limonene-1,2-epoxide hydrolase